MYIKSTTGITQYNVGDDRVIVFVGEYHDSEWSCQRDYEMSIFDFCNNRLKTNPNAVVLLEYNEKAVSVGDRKKYGAKIIRDVYTTTGDNFVRGRDIGVDMRLDHLTMDDQQLLYHGTKGFTRGKQGSVDLAKLVSIYDPTKTGLDHTLCGEYEPMLDEYKIALDKEFKRVKNDLDLVDLQWAWSKLMDYRILWEITRTDTDYTEIISVFGENHRKNLTEVLGRWRVKKIQDTGRCEIVK